VAAAVAHYQQQLAAPAGERARAYLAARGLAALATAWRFGYACGNQVADCGQPVPLLLAAGVLRQQSGPPYDPLAGRLVIPITDPLGRAVAFTGRALGDEQPKYLNTADTPLFKKGATLFGYYESSRTEQHRDELWVLEGQLKAVAAITAGYPAVAPGGTAFTADHAALCLRRATTIHLAYDRDPAGAKAAAAAARLLREHAAHVDIALLDIPDGAAPGTRDPDDLLRQQLPIAWQVIPYIQWRYEQLSAGGDPSAASLRVHQELLPEIAAHPVLMVRHREYQYVADQEGLPLDELLSALPTDEAAPVRAAAAAAKPAPAAPTADDLARSSPERDLYTIVLQLAPIQRDPTWWARLIPWEGLPLPTLRRLQEIAYWQSRAALAGVPFASLVSHAIAEPQRSYYWHWLHRPLPGAPADLLVPACKVLVDLARKDALKAAVAAGDTAAIAFFLAPGATP
jgi:DNA primase